MTPNKLTLDLDALQITSFPIPMPAPDASGTVVANSDPVVAAVIMAKALADAAAAAAHAAGVAVGAWLS